jgi:FtsH-binding integral membrane protein
MEPNYQNNNYNGMQGNPQNGYQQNLNQANGYQQNGYPQGGYQNNGYQQNPNQYAYQQNFNGYNGYNPNGGFNGYNNGNRGFTLNGQSFSGAFNEASEAIKQKVVSQSFLFMVVALAITAIGAKVASDVLLEWMMKNPVNMLILFGAEIAIVIVSNVAIKKNNVVLSASLFTAYSFINGATLGIVCMAYVETSVTIVFVITAAMFAVTAFYGLVAKKDLSSIGSLCIMGLIGLIITGLVNMFLQSEMMAYVASFVGVAVFVGLTAYDTQKIKKASMYADDSNVTALSLNGAFELYLDFINLFLYLLRIFGKRR